MCTWNGILLMLMCSLGFMNAIPRSLFSHDNRSSNVFFSFNLRTDGIGATMHHLLNAGAYAYYRGSSGTIFFSRNVFYLTVFLCAFVLHRMEHWILEGLGR